MSTTRRLLPTPPQTQALSSQTFRPPPVDGSRTIPQLYEWHLEHTPNHRLFVFAYDDGTTRDIFWPEAVRAIHVGARIVRNRLAAHITKDQTPVVAILASSDTITYFTTTVAVMRANYIVFPISPRNSAAAVAHLIGSVNATHILVGQEQAMIDLSNKALQILETNNPSVVKPSTSPIPLFQDLFLGENSIVNMDDFPITRTGSDDIIMYLHSSGSTAFPKPLSWTNYRFAQLSITPYFGEQDLTGLVWSLHTMPMFHGMGVAQFGWTATSGLIVAAFEPKSPAVIPTPDGLFKAAVATNSDIIFCVPAIIEAWSRKPEYIEWLATRGGVLFGGGPLNKAVGDYMTSQGVSIFILYGATEGGMMSPIIPATVDYDWEYFRFAGNVLPEMVPHGNGTFELVMVSNPFGLPGVLNTKVNGVDSYASSDLFLPHPIKKGYWKIYGRADDQIIHNTGEKTNPGPLENMLNQDPHVISSVMFGRGQFQAGIIVDPKPEFAFNPSDEAKLAEFRNKIWPTVQKMNDFAPQHSRLFKEMILVAKPTKPFHYTAKNTARRQAIINDYSDEIEALYASVEETTQSNIPPPQQWDIVSTADFVRAVISKVLVHKVNDDDDIFEHGCDSLQATWIRNSLLRALRDSARLDTRKSVDNFVYEHSSVTRLTRYIITVASGQSMVDGDAASQSSKASMMHQIVAKYTSEFPTRLTNEPPRYGHGKVVLLTGTTGALGCYLLARLVGDSTVSHIYAVNRIRRAGLPSLIEAQTSALLDRGLEPSKVLDSGKVTLLEADITVHGLALSSQVYDKLRGSVTHIIHNAWPVDFNLALASFEPNISGLRNLIDFSLSSCLHEPPKFIYTSSVGIFRNITASGDLPEEPIDAEVAIGTGYTESKWISEQILSSASKATSLKSLVVRVGQLCGGPNGAWNAKEWLPSMIQSASVIKCLPTDDRSVAWVPVNKAADTLVDFLDAFGSSQIVHLIHPHPVPWASLALSIASRLNVPVVPFPEWVKKLEGLLTSVKDTNSGSAEVDLLRKVQALRLLPLYREMALKTSESAGAFGFPNLSVTNAVTLSPTLSEAQSFVLNTQEGEKWLHYWGLVGLL